MALSHLVVQYESNFCTVALQFMEEEKNYPLPSPAATGGCVVFVWAGNVEPKALGDFYQRSLPNRVQFLLVVVYQRAKSWWAVQMSG